VQAVVVARFPRTGVTLHGLWERTPEVDELVKAGKAKIGGFETTLAQVIADLRLAPLSDDDEKKIRTELEFIIGRGFDELAGSPKYGGLQVSDVQRTLKRTAAKLDKIETLDAIGVSAIEHLLRGTDTGLQTSHDSAVAGKLIGLLARELGNYGKAYDLVIGFRKHPNIIADACRRAAKELSLITGKVSRPRIDWYRDFRRVLVFIAEKNGIRTTISVDPRTHKAQGSFLDLAVAFERLLLPHMRSPSSEACAKRLKKVVL
jgi:hypothetical protein